MSTLAELRWTGTIFGHLTRPGYEVGSSASLIRSAHCFQQPLRVTCDVWCCSARLMTARLKCRLLVVIVIPFVTRCWCNDGSWSRRKCRRVMQTLTCNLRCCTVHLHVAHPGFPKYRRGERTSPWHFNQLLNPLPPAASWVVTMKGLPLQRKGCPYKD